jgi:ATP-dependent RNA/DNA helicase IGHMBP2
MSPIDELRKLKQLLQLEKEEDFEQFKTLVKRLSLAERRDKGVSWYPVEVLKMGYSVGDRAFVTVRRTNRLKEPHQFRSGGTVSLFTETANSNLPERSGVINFLDKDRMKIILNSKDLPEWIKNGNIGVDMLFDETTYVEMEKAIDKVIKAKGDRLAELRDILLGKEKPDFYPIHVPTNIPTLNASQNDALNHVLSAQQVAVVHGPPGTGKTTTLVKTLKSICEREGTVLVCAPSNAAVDLLTERIAEEGINVVRIGNISRVSENLISHTLDGKLSQHSEMKNIKKIRKEAAESRRQAEKFKRKFGYHEKQERKVLYQEAKELGEWANQMEEKLIDQILTSTQVITATLVGTAGRYIDKMKFRTLIIDEAAQALEPAAWIPIAKASRVIFFGDPLQLPPTVKSMDAKKGGFGITLMEKGIQRLPQTMLLNMQYRMNEAIMNFSNQQFYENELTAHESVKDRTLELDEDLNAPVTFIDTAGCGFEEKTNEEYKSRYNPEEFIVLREHLYQLVKCYEFPEDLPSIGIVSPYREQTIYMKEMIAEDEALSALPLDINTIDAFQGQERDVIYISLVRSNTKSEIGFLKDYRRMNVAMTRAKKKLIIVGDSATLGNDPFYQNFLDYCDGLNSYKTAWEYMS